MLELKGTNRFVSLPNYKSIDILLMTVGIEVVLNFNTLYMILVFRGVKR